MILIHYNNMPILLKLLSSSSIIVILFVSLSFSSSLNVCNVLELNKKQNKYTTPLAGCNVDPSCMAVYVKGMSGFLSPSGASHHLLVWL